MLNTEVFTLSLTRSELERIHEALAMRHVVFDATESSDGPHPDEMSELTKVHRLLRPSETFESKTSQVLDERLLMYAWESFLNEWAWFRSHQEVTKELAKTHQPLDHQGLEQLIQERFEKDFDQFASELDMSFVKTPSSRETPHPEC